MPLKIVTHVSSGSGRIRDAAALSSRMDGYRQSMSFCGFVDRMVVTVSIRNMCCADQDNLHDIRMRPDSIDFTSSELRVLCGDRHGSFEFWIIR
ncbi:hypothetical protein D3C73_942380 [compost metagenome]